VRIEGRMGMSGIKCGGWILKMFRLFQGRKGTLRTDRFGNRTGSAPGVAKLKESSRTAPLKPKGAAPRIVFVLTSAPPA
jgi:hypothetical protein